MRNEESLIKPSTLKCNICKTPYVNKFLPHSLYGYDKGYWKDIPQCDCKKRLDEEKREKEGKISKGRAMAGRIREIKNCGLGLRYINKSFSNYDRTKNEKAYNICLDYARNFKKHLQKGDGLFLTGDVGTGKSHLAAAIVDYLARIKKSKLRLQIKYSMSSEILSEVRNAIKANCTEEVIEGYKECTLLIIDELGTENKTDFGFEVLYKIMNYRYNNQLPTIFITNFNDVELEEKLDKRIISRIIGTCRGAKLTGSDYRISRGG